MANIRSSVLLLSCMLIGFLSVPYSSWQDAARHLATFKSPLTWYPAERDQVVLHFIHNSLHHHLGAPAWDNMLPATEDAHIVHLQNADGTMTTQTVALFHQLRCIEILHKAYVDEGSHRTSDLAPHCLNYIRQTVMCQLDMTNEPQAGTQTSNGRESLCRDWESVYREAERNSEAFRKMVASR